MLEALRSSGRWNARTHLKQVFTEGGKTRTHGRSVTLLFNSNEWQELIEIKHWAQSAGRVFPAVVQGLVGWGWGGVDLSRSLLTFSWQQWILFVARLRQQHPAGDRRRSEDRSLFTDAPHFDPFGETLCTWTTFKESASSQTLALRGGRWRNVRNFLFGACSSAPRRAAFFCFLRGWKAEEEVVVK